MLRYGAKSRLTLPWREVLPCAQWLKENGSELGHFVQGQDHSGLLKPWTHCIGDSTF